VSGDWIVNAPSRAKRPFEILLKLPKRKIIPKKDCPFEDPQRHGNKPPLLVYPNSHKWAIQIFENKYPAVWHKENNCGVKSSRGPFSIYPGVGHHDVIVTRDHNKNFPLLSAEQANLVFQAFRDRYLMLYNDKCIDYISIFHNWGPAAGASVYHPHYQLIAIPVVPPDVNHSLEGSARFFKEHKKCVHCLMIDWEQKEKKRVIFENDGAIAFAPFVSRSPFEVRVFPKKHMPYFENTYDHDIASVVEALQAVLSKFKKNLRDPDYNFFVHTAPLRDKEKYRHYHWHIEAFPKVAIRAGFEYGTGVEINVIDPDAAAEILR
jgi:UDPglucose--hexose-1-phosphate uridylyltransferase